MGYPLRQEEFGGGFVYAMPEGRLSVGLVVGLDYKDPLFDPHMAFNRFKQHPFMRTLLEGGQMVRYGAKALPEGGWNSIPLSYSNGLRPRPSLSGIGRRSNGVETNASISRKNASTVIRTAIV